MYITGPPPGTRKSRVHTAIATGLAVIGAPLAMTWRRFPRRRAVAAAGGLALIATAFASGAAGPAPAASAASSSICLTYFNYCMAYDPQILNNSADLFGVAFASIILVNYPSQYPPMTIGFEWETGGPVFGRWNLP